VARATGVKFDDINKPAGYSTQRALIEQLAGEGCPIRSSGAMNPISRSEMSDDL
jgi:hypothetical protein